MIQEFLLPVGVLAAIASMVVPLPPSVLDFLLVGNLILAVVLLINTLFVSDPIKLSSLPTMLLLATLFRLALNVSTTRLILSTGEAGEAIEAFGMVVVQGNLAVGLVVFLVITLVQFIVIAKGSERVAEVAARFTLDALPGKQMSIDADVRAGILNFELAREKRQDLQTESRFYGALDGAMKFIKGDAIAGLVIIGINIVGGLITGLMVEGLSIGAAVHKYTLLTVGDGLLSQIPALLNSLAAGMVVTRVARGDESSLAKEILSQLGHLRRVKLLMAAVSLGFACAPGMPSAPFLTLVVLFLVSASFTKAPKDDAAAAKQGRSFQPRLPALFTVELPRSELAKLSWEQFRSLSTEVRAAVFDAVGVLLPELEIGLHEGAEIEARFKIRGLRSGTLPLEGDVSAWPVAIRERCVSLCCARIVDCIDDTSTRRMLDHYERECSELVSGVVPGGVSLTQLTELLRGLLQEQVSLRNFDQILQAVAEAAPRVNAERSLLEEVRVALRRSISSTLGGPQSTIEVFVLHQALDFAIQTPGPHEELVAILSQVAEEACRRIPAHGVLLSSKRSRKLLRDAIAARAYPIKVLAFEEISDDVRCVTVGELKIEHEEFKMRVVDRLAA